MASSVYGIRLLIGLPGGPASELASPSGGILSDLVTEGGDIAEASRLGLLDVLLASKRGAKVAASEGSHRRGRERAVADVTSQAPASEGAGQHEDVFVRRSSGLIRAAG